MTKVIPCGRCLLELDWYTTTYWLLWSTYLCPVDFGIGMTYPRSRGSRADETPRIITGSELGSDTGSLQELIDSLRFLAENTEQVQTGELIPRGWVQINMDWNNNQFRIWSFWHEPKRKTIDDGTVFPMLSTGYPPRLLQASELGSGPGSVSEFISARLSNARTTEGV